MLKKIAFGLFLLTIVCGAAVVFYGDEMLSAMMRKLVVADTLTKADIIVGLGGENLRRKESVKLFGEGYARRVLFTGFDIERDDYERFGLRRDQYVYPVKMATNTYEEAVVTRDVMKKEGLKTAIVVTSFFHSRRASYIFKKVLGAEGLKVIMVPVFNKKMDIEQWWKNRYLRKVILTEWAGLLYYWIEY